MHTPESQKILDIMNLVELIKGLKDERMKLMVWCSTEQKKLNDLKQKEEVIMQRLDLLKQEEYNKRYTSFGGGQYYSNDQ